MLVDCLLEAVDRQPRFVAMSDTTREWTFAEFARFSAIVRREIERATKCDRIGIMLPSCAAFGATFFGALWAGRTAVPLNFLLQPDELAAVIADSGMDTIFSIRHFQPMLSTLPVTVRYFEDLPLKRRMIFQRFTPLPSRPRPRPEDTAVILYTSGTAGLPKGVCLSHKNLHDNAAACITRAKLNDDNRLLGLLPLFHTFGLTGMLIVPILARAFVRYLPRFSPHTVIAEIRERRISVIMAVASMYGAMLRTKTGGREDLATLEYPVSGGEPLPDRVYDGIKQRFNVSLLQGYGLTETSPVVSLDVPWDHRRGTVGKPIPGVEVCARDDNDASVPAGQPGEIWVRGPGIMQGYYKKLDETAAVMAPDGWFRTGDMGTIDDGGYIRITGRKKELIIVGGENVYPREIEAVLDEHPSVAESAVIGKMDPGRGEIVVGFVVLREGMNADEIELRDFCRDKLANYKLPRRIIVRNDLPRGPTGKLLKRRLTEFL